MQLAERFSPEKLARLTPAEQKKVGDVIEQLGDGLTIGSKGWHSEYSILIGKLGGRPAIKYEELADEVFYYAKNYEEIGDVTPSHLGLCVYLGIDEGTLYNILKRIPDKTSSRFFKALALIKQHGKHKLAQKALKGEIKENMAKFILNVDHGMVERKETNLNVTGTVNITDALKGADKLKAIDAEVVDELKF